MAGYQKYTELDVWKQARLLASAIYEITSAYLKAEQFGIISQMGRCAVSVPSNIPEGCGRHHTKETIQFLNIARGSLYELETQLYISKDLTFISDEQLNILLIQIESLGKLLNVFIRFKSSELKPNKPTN